MSGEPFCEGSVEPCDCDGTRRRYLFRAGETDDPMGMVVQVGHADEPPLRTMWLDYANLLEVMVHAGIAHITGEGLVYQGPGEDPRPALSELTDEEIAKLWAGPERDG